jgi:hypothetical protein
MLIRRVVPAITATLAAYAGLALTAGSFLRQMAHDRAVACHAWRISVMNNGSLSIRHDTRRRAPAD